MSELQFRTQSVLYATETFLIIILCQLLIRVHLKSQSSYNLQQGAPTFIRLSPDGSISLQCPVTVLYGPLWRDINFSLTERSLSRCEKRILMLSFKKIHQLWPLIQWDVCFIWSIILWFSALSFFVQMTLYLKTKKWQANKNSWTIIDIKCTGVHFVISRIRGYTWHVGSEAVSIPCLSCGPGPEVSVEGSLWHLQNPGWALMPAGNRSWHRQKSL